MATTLLLKPVITEKSIDRTGKKQFTFEVVKGVSKQQIKAVVEKLFSVDVASVRTMNRSGKAKRVGKAKKIVHRSGRHFAMVTIGKDQTIDLFSVSPEQTK